MGDTYAAERHRLMRGDVRVTMISDPKFKAVWNKVCREQADRLRTCVEVLKGMGVAVVHPDDGWVNRKKNTLILCYPQYNSGGVEPGSLIALGSERLDDHVIGVFRIVRVTGIGEPGMVSRARPIHFAPVTGVFEIYGDA